MYDNLKSPGRNDECWCGSGRKYKKCHLDFDERLQSLYEQGFEVPQRSLLKTPEEIEGIKKSAAINIGVLDLVAERIGAGVSTEEIDKWIYDYTVEHGGIPAEARPKAFRVSQRGVRVQCQQNLTQAVDGMLWNHGTPPFWSFPVF